MKPSGQQLEALARLRSSQDFERFMQLVQEHEAELTERMVLAADPLHVHRAQGGIAACRLIRTMFVEAPANLERIKRNTP